MNKHEYDVWMSGRLRDAFRPRGLPIEDLAAELGMSTSTLRRRLSGETALLATELVRICEVTGRDASFFFASDGGWQD